MDNCGDFFCWLGDDVLAEITTLLYDPSDLIRMSLVSHSWRYFIIQKGFCKKLCVHMFPELSCFSHVTEVSIFEKPRAVGSTSLDEWETLKKEHKVYADLAHDLLSSSKAKSCIETSIHASSTDNYPDESIENTLEPRERVEGRPSYWSSKGSNNTDLPETLTYKLRSRLCVVNEINIRPFKATFQFGDPIYSAKAVKFRMGYSKFALDRRSIDESMEDQSYSCDNYIWTYNSPEFPMVQENSLQTFKLPKPVICIGGVLQIELLGRIQKQEMDDLYYICVCHVQVIGRLLSSVFDVDVLDTLKDKIVLKYSPDAENYHSPRNESKDDVAGSSGWQAIAARIRQIRDGRMWNRGVILNSLLGNATGNDNDSDEEVISS